VNKIIIIIIIIIIITNQSVIDTQYANNQSNQSVNH